MNCFIDQFVVCDPLDRNIEGEVTYTGTKGQEINALIKVEELKSRIEKLKPISTDKLMFTFEDSHVKIVKALLQIDEDKVLG